MPVTFQSIIEASHRISCCIRRTPILYGRSFKQHLPQACDLYLKLDTLQVTGSFKARGACNKLISLHPREIERGIIAASGGNHGRAVAYAGWLRKVPTVILLPSQIPEDKIAKIRAWGAQVVVAGEDLDASIALAHDIERLNRLAYIHPFADEEVIAGQGTLALEIFEDMKEVDVVIAAMGGGGLISGVGIAAKSLNPKVRVIGVEALGCAKFIKSLREGNLYTAEKVETNVGPLAVKTSHELNFDIIKRVVDEVHAVTDEEMLEASTWLWQEMSITAELSGAAAMAGLYTGKIKVKPQDRVCVLVCGAGLEGTVAPAQEYHRFPPLTLKGIKEYVSF